MLVIPGRGYTPASAESCAVRADRTGLRSHGFTLIEMVAVMLIIAMVAGLAVSFTAGTGRPQLEALALNTAALLRRERTSAILTGHSRIILLDGTNRSFAGDNGDVVRLPRDVSVDVLGADEIFQGEREVVRFTPDGAASGAVMRLSREGAGYEIRVNWFTGGVSVEKRDDEK
jgi:general secretion pathway protein H